MAWWKDNWSCGPFSTSLICASEETKTRYDSRAGIANGAESDYQFVLAWAIIPRKTPNYLFISLFDKLGCTDDESQTAPPFANHQGRAEYADPTLDIFQYPGRYVSKAQNSRVCSRTDILHYRYLDISPWQSMLRSHASASELPKPTGHKQHP